MTQKSCIVICKKQEYGERPFHIFNRELDIWGGLFLEEKQYAKAHKLLLSNRRTGTISGVTDVISFDIAEILL